MRYRFLFIGFLFFPIMKMGTGCIYPPDNTSPNEIGTQFFKSLQNKKISSSPSRFWETANVKEIATDTTALKQSGWYANVISAINAKEYEINYDPELKSYTSPNRKNNLRALYTTNTFTLSPRNDSADKWKLELALQGIYSGKQKIYSPDVNASVARSGQAIRFNHNNDFTVEYINNEEGVRQNFIIQKAPVSQPKTINIKLRTNSNWFVNKVNDTEIHFAKATQNGYDKKITYNRLKVWDANNKELDAFFTVDKNTLSINVETRGAIYPLTIDPLSATINWSAEGNQASAIFGAAVSSAGDVNGDGYSDVIVGAPFYDDLFTDEGKTFLYYGSATGLSLMPGWTYTGNQNGADLGRYVASAGDVNGDGYSDVIIGAQSISNGQSAEGKAFVFHGSVSGLSITANWTAESNQATAYFGQVACAGDVNGDGYSDVIVGAYAYDNGQTDEGMVFAYYGSATGLSATANWTVESNQSNSFFGWKLASAGDVNGDGYSDVIVGAYSFDSGETDEGKAFVYYGSASGLSVTANWTGEVNQVAATYGRSVASAGDVNGDGYSDVVVGADQYDNGQTDEGAAFVYYGSSSGLSVTANWTGESNLSINVFGCSVACAGDINADGYSDIIIGSSNYSSGTGRAYIFYGSFTGLPVTANFIFTGSQSGAFFGLSIASAGDVNGDGYSDILVGSTLYDNGQTDEGAAFVYHGSAFGINNAVATQIERNMGLSYVGFSVACAGDVNADGYSDVVVGARTYDTGIGEGAAFVFHGASTGLSNTVSAQIESDQFTAYLGNSVACAGDVNGDGYSDIIVGSILYDNGQSDEGVAFVYHGSASGINPIFVTRLERNQADAQMGCCVAGAGDVNGDGYSDVIVGAKFYDNGQTDEGVAFVYHGSATGITTTVATLLERNQASAFLGQNVASAGDVNGDGYGDIIVGAPNYDNGQTDEGAAFVYHGSTTGLNAVAATLLEANQASAGYGTSVACAGDVNGDGYSDVIAGAPYLDNGQTDEGVAYVYHGSSTGLSTVFATLLEINQVSAIFGFSVASAGDVNGDGYSDVIVGGWTYDNGSTDEGGAFMYQGSATGISSTLAIQMEINQASAYFGYSVASAGDVNGDGFSDVIVGAPNYDNPSTDEGGAFCYLGHAGVGKRNNLRLYNTDLTTPIQRSNYLNPNLFGAGLFVQSPLGRMKARLVWEVKAQGVAFSGNPITNSTSYYSRQPSFTDLGIAGTELKYQVQKVGRQTKIRARVEYNKATAITGQVYGPWKYTPAYTQGAYGMNAVPLPLQLISFAGQFINKDDVQLQWTTSNEINMQQFIIERSEDGINFSAMGELAAKGTGAAKADYAFLDRNVKAVFLYYRLKLKEQNGDISYSHIITLSRIKKTNNFIAPNPVASNSNAVLTIHSSASNTVRIGVFNTAGQLIFEKDALLQNGSNQINISTKGFSKGIYVVSVWGKAIKESYRLIVH